MDDTKRPDVIVVGDLEGILRVQRILSPLEATTLTLNFDYEPAQRLVARQRPKVLVLAAGDKGWAAQMLHFVATDPGASDTQVFFYATSPGYVVSLVEYYPQVKFFDGSKGHPNQSMHRGSQLLNQVRLALTTGA